MDTGSCWSSLRRISSIQPPLSRRTFHPQPDAGLVRTREYTMAGRLEGKVAVITGGDGIARATALRFAAEGAKVLGTDLVEAKVSETVRMVADAGGEMTGVGTDLMDEAAVNRLMKLAEQTYGGIDILAHFAMDVR